jgi:predicted membrane-bound spermidine synthase
MNLAIVSSVARRSDQAALSLALFLFFLSGFSALLYQVIWQRMLALFSGADVYSVTLIVAAFMGGLGLGSMAGGHLADRLSLRGRVACFGGAELLIAVFALTSKWFYYDFLYERLGDLARSPAAFAPLLFLSLLWPTFLMGTTLPLLSRALTARIEAAAHRIGALYGLNTLGAAAGAFATTWFLVRRYDFETNLWWGATINFLTAAGSLALLGLLSLSRGGEEPAANPGTRLEPAAKAGSHPARPPSFSFSTWMLVYALSGFTALSLEIVWFRLLGVMVKASAFTFGNLLGIYLTGLAAGTVAGLRFVQKSRRPASTFFALQAGIGAYVAASAALLVAGLPRWEALARLSSYFGQYEPMGVAAALQALSQWLGSPWALAAERREIALQFVTLYFLLPAALIGPPTVMMGLSFPFLQKVVQQDTAFLGRRVGWLQTANINGSLLGALVAGWILLRVMGSAGTLKLLVVLGGVLGLLWVRTRWSERARSRRLAGAGVIACYAALAIVAPSGSRLWPPLHGTTPDHILFAEDETGLSAIKRGGPEGQRATVYANGSGESWIPYGGIHSWLGFFPALLHPLPVEIAIIGLGSGDTLFYAGVRRETRRITCIELVRSQLQILAEHHRREGYAGLESIFTDDRLQLEFTDGRAFLKRSRKRYDIIEADALRPHSANAGNLYSYEYFSLLKERLRTNGLAVSWAPTGRVTDTFASVFPHALAVQFRDLTILIGSNQPISYDPAQIQARLTEPFTRDYFGRLNVDLAALARRLSEVQVRAWDANQERKRSPNINRDLFPKDEFLVR